MPDTFRLGSERKERGIEYVGEPTRKQEEYWNRNLGLTGFLLLIWFVATFVVAYFARQLSEVGFLGWPLGFYMAAQGSLIVYVIIVWYYARAMDRLDHEYGFAEGDESGEAR